ncbi:HAMP domain-containing sensor histidine kinase [Hydrogenophaga sp. 5NK40-0174]|uniref:sensor histidine kinase n=1 Tax=Hydrogenophaga sp. 5NK40-0174 TaxID=3127649 RepID=UPI0033413A03
MFSRSRSTDELEPGCGPWHRRARHKLGHSIKLRMVMLFLLLASAMTFVFIAGAQKAFSLGWREAARPIMMDYVDHLVAEITNDAGTPDRVKAQAVVARLPLTVSISGPSLQWQSHPDDGEGDDHLLRSDDTSEEAWGKEHWGGGKDWDRILTRTTADGHTVTFGIDGQAFERRPRVIGYALLALLLLTWLAYAYVRFILRPLDDIQAGAQRFGKGDFTTPIPVRCTRHPDELGQLADTINEMGKDIHQMLEAKRALLLAISHELRSPLTRARLNAELLPEEGDTADGRAALLRDLQEMACLIADLLESERLAGNHAVLQREPIDLPDLARGVLRDLAARHPRAKDVTVDATQDMPKVAVDASRVRLLMRNLLDNALRHSTGAPEAPEVHVSVRQGEAPDEAIVEVRDHGPGVPEDQLERLTEAFYRPDSARTRGAGGVGLGLYLCKLVVMAHGGSFTIRNANPGLSVVVTLRA